MFEGKGLSPSILRRNRRLAVVLVIAAVLVYAAAAFRFSHGF